MGDSYSLHHSLDPEVQQRKSIFKDFLEKLENCMEGKNLPFTIIIRDPLGNSFISAPLGTFLPPEMDSNLELLDFERSWEEVCYSSLSIFLGDI